jgi:hypothetical protein
MSPETGHGAVVQNCPPQGWPCDPGENSRPCRLGGQRCGDTIRIWGRFTPVRIPGLVQHESCDGCCVTQLSELGVGSLFVCIKEVKPSHYVRAVCQAGSFLIGRRNGVASLYEPSTRYIYRVNRTLPALLYRGQKLQNICLRYSPGKCISWPPPIS